MMKVTNVEKIFKHFDVVNVITNSGQFYATSSLNNHTNKDY